MREKGKMESMRIFIFYQPMKKSSTKKESSLNLHSRLWFIVGWINEIKLGVRGRGFWVPVSERKQDEGKGKNREKQRFLMPSIFKLLMTIILHGRKVYFNFLKDKNLN